MKRMKYNNYYKQVVSEAHRGKDIYKKSYSSFGNGY